MRCVMRSAAEPLRKFRAKFEQQPRGSDGWLRSGIHIQYSVRVNLLGQRSFLARGPRGDSLPRPTPESSPRFHSGPRRAKYLLEPTIRQVSGDLAVSGSEIRRKFFGHA